MAEARQRPLDEVLFGAQDAQNISPEASLADLIAAWCRVRTGKFGSRGTPSSSPPPRRPPGATDRTGENP